MFEFADIDALNYYKKAEDRVIFFFETPWCDKCESFLSEIINKSEYLEGIPVYRVEMDMDAGDLIRKKFDIEETPTLVLYVDGEEDRRTTDQSLLIKLLS